NCNNLFTTEVIDGVTYYKETEIRQHLQIDPHCPRLVYTPIVTRITSPTLIQGFAAFFLDRYQHDGNNITLVGCFIGVVNPEEVVPSTLNYTTQSVMLVE
ncbi:MAG: hypothetical protein ACYC21_12590, partial [Eubacteriales bacterium]